MSGPKGKGERLGGFELLSDSDGVTVLRSPLLLGAGVCHAFPTRRGGVSLGTMQSLNFGEKGGDDPRHVRENERRLCTSLGLDRERLYRLRQVHGRQVVLIGAGHPSPETMGRTEGDALVTSEPGAVLGIGTADCVPVLLADPEAGVVAGAHAGWRGLCAGVLEATVEVMVKARGCRGDRILAAVGPAIGACCYEVDEDVARFFEEETGVVQRERGCKPHLDLGEAARLRLTRLGATVDRLRACTRCQAELFYSYRRDGEATGHHLSVIGFLG